MRRRSFFKALAGALIATQLAIQLTAKAPEKITDPYQGFSFAIDPFPLRYTYSDDGLSLMKVS